MLLGNSSVIEFMQQLTFHCTNSNFELQLQNGLTKSETIDLQNNNPEKSDFYAKVRMQEQFADFAHAIAEHARECEGHIVVDPASFVSID